MWKVWGRVILAILEFIRLFLSQREETRIEREEKKVEDAIGSGDVDTISDEFDRLREEADRIIGPSSGVEGGREVRSDPSVDEGKI